MDSDQTPLSSSTPSVTQILLVEDDPVLGKSLKVSLEVEGFNVHWARSLSEAKRHMESASPFHLIILDRGLPDGEGLKLCREVRSEGMTIPIIVLTALTDETSVVEGLEAGANDYVRKPFGTKELLARVRAHLREVIHRDKQVKWNNVVVSLEKRQVRIDGVEVELNRREFDIFLHLIKRPETVVARSTLIEALDKEGEIFDRTIDSHISHIRNRLKSAHIETIQITSVYGVGYRLEKR